MGQPCGLREVVIIQLKGWRQRRIEDLELLAQHLNLTRGQIWINGALGALAHHTSQTQAKLIADAFSNGKGVLGLGVGHYLGQARAITQIDKNHTTVVTTTVHPTILSDWLTQMLAINLA